MKMVQIEQAMPMQMESNTKRSPPSNLVAKLMGLDSLPNEGPDSLIRSGHSRSHSDIPLSYWEEQDDRFFHCVELDRHRDSYEESKQPLKFMYQEGSTFESETMHDKTMVLVRQKFLEAKNRCMNEKNCQLKQFHEESISVIPPRKSERITVLNASRMANDVYKSSSYGPVNGEHANYSQPTRIVVLKPKRLKASSSLYSSQLDSPRMFGEEFIGAVEERNGNRESVKAITIQMCRKLSGYHIDDTMNPGADMPTLSRHSCDYLSSSGVPYSPSGFSRASYSGESSVSREAKKRLSERWALMASNLNSQTSGSTLGEMLSLSAVKKKVTKAKGKCKEHKNSNPKFCNEIADHDANGSPRNHKRSKSLPTSCAFSGTKLNMDNLVPGSKHGALRERTSVRSSLKEKVTSLFFSKNKQKTSKDKALCSDRKDECRERNGTLYNRVPRHSSSRLLEPSCIGTLGTVIGKQGMGFLEVGLAPKKHTTSQSPGENQDHPSPISVLDTQFEEDELLTAKVFPQCEQFDRHGLHFQLDPTSSKLLDKSPLIGSIARTLSWDHLCTDAASLYPSKESLTIQESGDKQEWIHYLKTLLSTVLQGDMLWSTFFSRWHSPQIPLNPSLREIDIIFKDKEATHEVKRRQQRSIQKLLFDLVNALLLDTGHEPDSNHPRIEAKKGNSFKNISSSTILDEVTSQITAWFCGETRSFSDDNTLVVELVVTEEVSGKGWSDELYLEMGNLGKEMEQKLLDELVLETLFELTGN